MDQQDSSEFTPTMPEEDWEAFKEECCFAFVDYETHVAERREAFGFEATDPRALVPINRTIWARFCFYVEVAKELPEAFKQELNEAIEVTRLFTLKIPSEA